MRKIAKVSGHSSVKRLILYSTDDETFLFESIAMEDVGGSSDTWFASLQEAEEAATQLYGVIQSDWKIVDDPMEHCQHDYIRPVRVIGRESGAPQWGNLEELVNGIWRPFKP